MRYGTQECSTLKLATRTSPFTHWFANRIYTSVCCSDKSPPSGSGSLKCSETREPSVPMSKTKISEFNSENFDKKKLNLLKSTFISNNLNYLSVQVDLYLISLCKMTKDQTLPC
jgi:hypothetical protein